MYVRIDPMVWFLEEWHETIVEMLDAVIRERPKRNGALGKTHMYSADTEYRPEHHPH